MCGIFGGYRFDSKRWTRIERAISSLRHRGPDDSGFFESDRVLLGNTRLAIQDIRLGHQPFESDNKQVVVVQNGEIYNHIELRRELERSGVKFKTDCDTEVILRLYEKEGLEFVSRLNGMFAIAIYDARDERLHLIRDRLGVKPLFLAEYAGNYGFASEIKTIFGLLDMPARLNSQALSDYLSFNYVPPPETMFLGVHHVPPGFIVTLGSDGMSSKCWWSLASEPADIVGSDECWGDELLDILMDATRIRLRSDAPIGAFLSGGLDSSTVVALASRITEERLPTFSIGFHDSLFDETPYASLAASRFNADLTTSYVDQDMLDRWPRATYFCDQPHGDVSFLPTWRVSELAAGQVKVVLTGDGGDELFAGYSKYLDFYSKFSHSEGGSPKDFASMYWPYLTLFDDQEKRRLIHPDLVAKQSCRESIDLVRDIEKRYSKLDPINKALLVDTFLLLPGNNLVKPDRMGMAASLEARSPFLDYRIVELAFRLHGSLKLSSTETKLSLKRVVSPLIGDDLAYRKKQMFTVPVGQWFKTDRKDYCSKHLRSLAERGMVHRESVSRIFDQHISGEVNRTRELRALVALDHWCDQFNVSA